MFLLATSIDSITLMDILIIGVIGLGMYRGYNQGIIKEAVGGVAIVAAVICAFGFRDPFEKFFLTHFGWGAVTTSVVSFVLVFILTLVTVQFLIKFLDDLLNKLYLGGINKGFGALFGGLKYTLGLSIVLFLLSLINIPSQQSVKDSITYPYVKVFAVKTLEYAQTIIPFVQKGANGFGDYIKRNTESTSNDYSEDPPPNSGEDPKDAPHKPKPIR